MTASTKRDLLNATAVLFASSSGKVFFTLLDGEDRVLHGLPEGDDKLKDVGTVRTKNGVLARIELDLTVLPPDHRWSEISIALEAAVIAVGKVAHDALEIAEEREIEEE